MKRKIVGYGYRLVKESWHDAVNVYIGSRGGLHNFHRTRKEVLDEIKADKAQGNISKQSKPKIFKLTLEDVE